MNALPVTLRAIRSDEFDAYQRYFIAAYSEEIAENFGLDEEQAKCRANHEFQRCFPDGITTVDHDLMCIETEVDQLTQVVGYLWFSANLSERSAFIYDFFVFAEYRSMGVGQQAIQQLEQKLAALGMEQIKLRVAFHNPRALALYQKIGFTITGYNMAKLITDSEAL